MGNYAYSLRSSRRISAARSPMMTQGAIVLPVVTMIVPALRVRRKLALIVADAFGKIVAIGVGHADGRT